MTRGGDCGERNAGRGMTRGGDCGERDAGNEGK